MATGGDLTRSVIGSSDIIYDFSCTPCSDASRNTEAFNFCINCESYFCKACLQDHNKFRSMKGHRILDEKEMKSRKSEQNQVHGQKKTAALPTDECVDHPGNVVQMYCERHDAVCCTVCVALEHRTCSGVEFIPKVAKDLLRNEGGKTKLSLEKVKDDIRRVRSEKIREITELDKRRDDVLKEIEVFKKQLLARIAELEKRSIQEITSKHKEIRGKINDDIKSLDDKLHTVETKLKNMDQTASTNEAQLFVHFKSGKKLQTKCSSLLEEVSQSTGNKFSFEINKEILTLLKDIEALISSSDNRSSSASKQETRVCEYDIKEEDDEKVCNIYDICKLNNEEFVITDCDNDKLKRIDRNFRVKDSYRVSGRPLGICKISNKELAVCMWGVKKIQFIYVGRTLLRTRSFDVDVYCKGICYSQATLFIPYGNHGIRAYSTVGKLIRDCQRQKEILGDPCLIAASQDGTRLYVADTYKGVVVFDRTGEKHSVVSNPKLSGPFGVCMGEKDEVFISGYTSSNVFRHDSRSNTVHEILNQSDGLLRPHGLAFLPNPRRLIVTSDLCNEIKVFKI